MGRFIRIVTESKAGRLPAHESASVDNILVITFTEKATKEMKARIVSELNARGLVEERRQVETAYISTIHGFCSRLLQENPFEAGIDPQFSVLTEPQARRLLRQTFGEVVAQAYEIDHRPITELFAAGQGGNAFNAPSGDPMVLLAGSIEAVLGKLRGAGKRLEEIDAHLEGGPAETARLSLLPVHAILEPIQNEVRACAQAITLISDSLLGGAKTAWQLVEEHVRTLTDPDRSVEELLVSLDVIHKSVGKARLRPGVSTWESEMFSLFNRIKISCEEAKLLFGVVAGHEADAAAASHKLLQLVAAVWRAYTTAKRIRGKLDTEDLQSEGARLLETAPHVCARYRRRFRHLMVDEFQDTNPLQMRLVELLHCQAGAHKNALFVVGDVQQSIYGFRNADPRLFQNLERQFREQNKGRHLSLSVNFRSRPEILAAVSHVFRHIWNASDTPYVPLSCGQPFDRKAGPSLEILASQDLIRRDYIPLEAEALAARVQQMVEGEELTITSQFDARRGQTVRYRDIAILMRGLTDIQKYEEAFTRRGVPFYVVGGGRGYYARHEIRDLLNALTVLDSPLDDVALAATLRSPLIGIESDTLYRLSRLSMELAASSDGERRTASRAGDNPLYPALKPLIASGLITAEECRKIQRFLDLIETFRGQEDRLPVGHLLERLIAFTQYDARLLCRPGGRRRLANVRKLLQMANAEPVTGVRDFIRRFRELERLSDREGDAPTEEEAADVTRFMTIHGAKGLEYPVVILADMSRSLTFPERGLFACEPGTVSIGAKLRGEPNVVYKAIDLRRQQADREESNRLLYVAMTRAREHLILSGNMGRNRGLNWADDLFRLVGFLDCPNDPETRTLVGGIVAQTASLAYYAHRQLEGANMPGYKRTLIQTDRIAEALLADASLEELL